jgi:hypothetical protein
MSRDFRNWEMLGKRNAGLLDCRMLVEEGVAYFLYRSADIFKTEFTII